MNELLKNKLERIIMGDEGIYGVDISYKCKTKDGMLCTIDCDEFKNREDEDHSSFCSRVVNTVIETIMALSENSETEGFIFSVEEIISIKKSEIIRIWAEIGDIYTESFPNPF